MGLGNSDFKNRRERERERNRESCQKVNIFFKKLMDRDEEVELNLHNKNRSYKALLILLGSGG